MATIATKGEASAHFPPERGTVSLRVSFTGERRDEVLQRAQHVHAYLVDAAKGHVDASRATWWGADGVSASGYDEWIKPHPHQDAQKVRRFRAGSTVQVKFSDFAALSQWVGTTSLVDGVSVHGVAWTLTRVRREAEADALRAAAAVDALRRAQAFAASLGLGPVRLVTLYEDGLRPHVAGGDRPIGVGPGVRAMAASTHEESPEFELRPEDIVIEVVVTADFEAG